MAAKKKSKASLKSLKKQIKKLQRKELQSRNKLKSALKKIRKLGRSYKSKLTNKIRLMKTKIAKTHASAYTRIAKDLEKQMLRGIESKGKSIQKAMLGFEKKYISKLTKGISKKGKKAGKARKAKKVSVVKVKRRTRSRRSRRH